MRILPTKPSAAEGHDRNAPAIASRPWFVCALLVVATLVAYGRVAQCGFVSYDDNLYFRENGWVQIGLTLEGLKWAFTTGHAANWHPLTWLSLMLDREFLGAGASGPHMVNLLFHAANGVLLFLLLRRATGAHWWSAVVAGLFALHPLHVESVAWIAERKDVLSAFFGLLALVFYVRYAQSPAARTKQHATGQERLAPWRSAAYRWALYFFALGLLSKPMLVTWPFVLLLLDWWPLARMPAFSRSVAEVSASSIQSLIREKLAFIALSFLSCVVTFVVQQRGGAIGTLVDLPLVARVENAFVAYARYLVQTFWPFDLAVIYPHPEHRPWTTVAWAVSLILGLTALAVWRGRERRFLATGWFWFVGMLVPVIGLVQIGAQAMADRYTYLPLIGVFIGFVWGANEITARWLATRRAKILVGAATGLVLLACVARTDDQLRYWQNGETLARHALVITENNYVAHDVLGTALLDNGKPAEAIESYRRAIQLKPAFIQARNNLGLALSRAGQLADAEQSFREALRINPAFADAHNNLGSVLAALGRDDEAEACFRRALQHNPRYAEALNNLGRLAARRGQNAEAIACYRRALRLHPALADAAFNLGNALARQGLLAEAARNYRLAVRLQPADAEAHRNLGWTLARLGRRQEAIAHFTEALRLKPDDSATRQQLRALGVKD